MRKKIILPIILSLLIVFGYFTLKDNFLTKPNNYFSMQILSNDLYSQSYLVYADESGSIFDKVKLPKGKGVGYTFLRQVGNQVYFDAYPSSDRVLSYDYSTKNLVNLGNLSEKYDRINPYSEQLFIVLNNGYSEDGESYRSGFCYFDKQWKCKKIMDEHQVLNGVVYEDYIYVFAINAIPHTLEDGSLSVDELLMIYDKDFNYLNSIDLHNKFNLGGGDIEFYLYDNNLFLLGEDIDTNELKIIQVDKSLNMMKSINYPQISDNGRKSCTLGSSFKVNDEGVMYYELLCEKGQNSEGYDSNQYQEDNLVLKLDFDRLESNNIELLELGDSRIVGGIPENNMLLVLDRLNNLSYHPIKVFDFDFNYQQTINIERFDNRTPTLIDIRIQ